MNARSQEQGGYPGNVIPVQVLWQDIFRGSEGPLRRRPEPPTGFTHLSGLLCSQRSSEVAFSRGPHLLTITSSRAFIDPAFAQVPGPAPGMEPPTLSFTKEAPLDLQTESI